MTHDLDVKKKMKKKDIDRNIENYFINDVLILIYNNNK